MTRVYLPTTFEDVRALLGGTPVLPGAGVVLADPAEDPESAEYAALMTAADACAGLDSMTPRRVVLVAEVSDVQAPVHLDDVVALHADLADRGPDADPDDDLAWFATQEITHLVG